MRALCVLWMLLAAGACGTAPTDEAIDPRRSCPDGGCGSVVIGGGGTPGTGTLPPRMDAGATDATLADARAGTVGPDPAGAVTRVRLNGVVRIAPEYPFVRGRTRFLAPRQWQIAVETAGGLTSQTVDAAGNIEVPAAVVRGGWVRVLATGLGGSAVSGYFAVTDPTAMDFTIPDPDMVAFAASAAGLPLATGQGAALFDLAGTVAGVSVTTSDGFVAYDFDQGVLSRAATSTGASGAAAVLAIPSAAGRRVTVDFRRATSASPVRATLQFDTAGVVWISGLQVP